jgi:hypothetical protein
MREDGGERRDEGREAPGEEGAVTAREGGGAREDGEAREERRGQVEQMREEEKDGEKEEMIKDVGCVDEYG